MFPFSYPIKRFCRRWHDSLHQKLVAQSSTQRMVNIIQAHQMDWHPSAIHWQIIRSIQKYPWKQFAKVNGSVLFGTHSYDRFQLVYVVCFSSFVSNTSITSSSTKITCSILICGHLFYFFKYTHKINHHNYKYDGNCTFI